MNLMNPRGQLSPNPIVVNMITDPVACSDALPTFLMAIIIKSTVITVPMSLLPRGTEYGPTSRTFYLAMLKCGLAGLLDDWFKIAYFQYVQGGGMLNLVRSYRALEVDKSTDGYGKAKPVIWNMMLISFHRRDVAE
jgi:hypothetical protein